MTMERPPTSLLDVAPSSIRALFQNRLGLDVEAIEIPDIVAAYHEIYFITLSDGQEVVLRVARDGSCADKTEIEIATLQYVGRGSRITDG